MRIAEELFAEYGIEAVSPRQIALAAGQHNQSAIRYHFGTKETLIETLLTRRMAEINARRSAMLRALEREDRLADVRSLVSAVAVPLAEKVQLTPEGGFYVRFLAHLFADRQRRDILIAREDEAALLRRLYAMLRRLVPPLPDLIWNERLRLMVGGVIHALAGRERLRVSGDPSWRGLPETAFVNNLVDVGVAILTAPLSPATLGAMRLNDRTSKQGEGRCCSRLSGQRPRGRAPQSRSSGGAPQSARRSAASISAARWTRGRWRPFATR
ncbi:MAG TPA: TetR family transcriptional regulator [Stellaceae bacterium]|nr:TetR family transcriptional regulator [Stellaceae bacterium]